MIHNNIFFQSIRHIATLLEHFRSGPEEFRFKYTTSGTPAPVHDVRDGDVPLREMYEDIDMRVRCLTDNEFD